MNNFDEPIYDTLLLEYQVESKAPTMERWPTHSDFLRKHEYAAWLIASLGLLWHPAS